MQRNRLYLLGAAAAVAIVAVVVIVVVAGNGGSKSPTTTAASTTPSGPTSRNALFAGIPQKGDLLGKSSAPATLTVFEDPQCPYCRQWNEDTLPTVIDRYVKTGRIRLQYHGIVIIGINSVAGLRAIYAAGNQGKLWNMVEALYDRQGDENSGWITVGVIKDAAKSLGLDAAKLLKDADTKAVTEQMNASQHAAVAAKVAGTPTFVLQKTLGQPTQIQVGGLEPDQFTPALDQALQ